MNLKVSEEKGFIFLWIRHFSYFPKKKVIWNLQVVQSPWFSPKKPKQTKCLLRQDNSWGVTRFIQGSMSSIFVQDLGSSFPSLLWVPSQIDRLFPLHLVVGFYLAPLSASYFFVISLGQTYCVCGLFSAVCRLIIVAVSGVCSLVGEVGREVCAIPLTGGLSDVVVIRASPGCWVEPPLCSVIALSGLLPSCWRRAPKSIS